MNITDNASIEARLNAHRRLMVSLFSTLASIPNVRDALAGMLEDGGTISDHEEDPGVEPDTAYAMQRIADEEIRAILQAALSRYKARHDIVANASIDE